MEAMLWRLRTGSPWRDLPTELGAWKTSYNFFNRWSKRGAWKKIFEALRGEMDDEWNFLDSTAVKLHADGHGARGRDKASQAIGKSRGGWTTKLHARCDAQVKSLHQESSSIRVRLRRTSAPDSWIKSIS
jgi:transposase